MSAALEQDADLTPLNSFGVAARAAWLQPVRSAEDALSGWAFAREQGLPVLILGGGSNVLLVNDFPGLVLHVCSKGMNLDDPAKVTVSAGENWHDFVTSCLNSSLHGLENLALIPGTVGAAPVQNIGAYGAELEQFVVAVEALNLASGEVLQLSREDCEFEYRSSLFKRDAETPWLILGLTLALSRDWQPNLEYAALREALDTETPSAQQVFDTVCKVRQSKLPDPASLGNAGSFFKNPVVSAERYQQLQQDYPELPSYPVEPGLVKLPAAWLLEQAGWKGKRRGDAAVHDKHALVLVNHGHASGEDLFLLAQAMSSSVLQKFGVALQPEVRIL